MHTSTGILSGERLTGLSPTLTHACLPRPLHTHAHTYTGILSLALKEVSDRGLLSGALPRNLNWGLAGMSGLVAAITVLGVRVRGTWYVFAYSHLTIPFSLPGLTGLIGLFSATGDTRHHVDQFQHLVHILVHHHPLLA